MSTTPKPSWFTRLFRKAPRTVRKTPPTRLGLESLQTRDVPAYLSAGSLVIDGTAGNDNVSVNFSASFGIFGSLPKYTVVENGRTQTFSPFALTSGQVIFRGNSGHDTFRNNSDLRATADGGLGNDTLIGGWGDDTLMGGEGFDTLDGGEGNDYLPGGNGNDVLYGRAGTDNLAGDEGNDTLYGGTGRDLLSAGGGNDYLFGETGNDDLYGYGGNDFLSGGEGTDYVSGNDGNDYVFGGTENDTVNGGPGADVLYGEDGNDLMSGGEGSDTLYGGDGSDRLLGGANDGFDSLWGEGGADRFLVLANQNVWGERYDEDGIGDLADEDARPTFLNGGWEQIVISNVSTTYPAKMWTDADVLRADAVLGVLQDALDGRTTFLEKSDGADLVLVRHGGTARGVNMGDKIHMTDAPSQFGDTNAGDYKLRGYLLHEIGHNWQGAAFQSGGAGSFWTPFTGVSEWTSTDPGDPALTLSANEGNGNRWYRSGTGFASTYAQTNEDEDFAESFSAYFAQRAGWTFYNGAGAAAIPEKIDLLGAWVGGL